MVTSKEYKVLRYDASGSHDLLNEYLDFLRNHRGLNEDTVRMRQHDITAFLKSLGLQNDREDIKKISVSQIYDYVIKAIKPMGRPTQKQIITSIRSFLKFTHFKGYIPRALTEARLARDDFWTLRAARVR